MAYLFLFALSLSAQHKPAWEYKVYKEIFTLKLTNDFSSEVPAEAYIAGFKTGVSNLIAGNPTPAEAIAKIEASTKVVAGAEIPEMYRLYYLNDLHLLNALMELQMGNEVKFMWMMNQLYRNTEKLSNDYPDFLPAKKLHAIMLIMIGSVPDQYQWIFNLLGFQGDSEKGLKALEELSSLSSPLQYEGKALYYIITSYLKPELREAKPGQLSQELKEIPELLLLHYIAGLSHMKQHHSLEARSHFLPLINQRDISTAHYFVAETYLHEGIDNLASEHYQKFIEKNHGENLLKDAWFKLFLISYMNGDPERMAKYRQRALKEGNSRSEADKNAEKLLNAPVMPHPVIFRIRFLTDGGFYEQAQVMVEQYEYHTFSDLDKTEFIYRKARLNHLTGKLQDAVNGYKNILALKDERYFKPNSALQLGYIFELQGQKDQAEYYFNKVLEFKNYTYENSIRGKARLALKNLNNKE